MRKVIKFSLCALLLSSITRAEEVPVQVKKVNAPANKTENISLPAKEFKAPEHLKLMLIHDMKSNYQNDKESITEISNAGSTWVRKNGYLIGTPPTDEYNAKKKAERAKLGKNAHTKHFPTICFPVSNEFNKNNEFGYILHFLVKSNGEAYKKNRKLTIGIKTGGAHDATSFNLNVDGITIGVESKKRSIKEALASTDTLKLESDKWYEIYIDSNRQNVEMKVRDTTTGKTIAMTGKHAELNRHNKRIAISGSSKLQTISLADINYSYYTKLK